MALSHKIRYYFYTYYGHVSLPYLVLDVLRQACDIVLFHHHPIAKPTLPTKFRLVKAMVFPVVMYGCESWTVKKAERRRIDAFELWCWRRLLNPLDCKDIQPVHSEGDQPWDFFGRNDAKAETPVLWPPHAKS